ncbi:MAG: RcnB family protein [Caulobacteraceae bacterium]
MKGPARAQLGQQWRGQHPNIDRNAPWRGNSNWWRSDPGFRQFTGARAGFFFFPNLGYIAAPAQYRNHTWRAGDNLPSWFWRYTVSDYGRYGLPEPPDGCAWIWLNGDVALVDLSDGYIIDLVANVW